MTRKFLALSLWLVLMAGTAALLTLALGHLRRGELRAEQQLQPSMTSAPETLKMDLLATAKETDGNANGFEGGDPLDGKLADARATLGRALALLDSGFETESLCAPRRCNVPEEAGLCGMLRALSAPARKACREFIISHAAELVGFSSEKATPFRLSDAPLSAPSANGKTRPVSAVTSTSTTGPVTFHYGSIRELAPSVLLALLGHEVSHKLGIDDNAPAGVFANGRALLDTIGAALAIYAAEVAAPRGAPPRLVEGPARDGFCREEFDPAKHFLLALSADASGELPLPAQTDEWKASFDALSQHDRTEAKLVLATRVLSGGEARRAAIRSMFQRFYLTAPSDRELDTTLRRIASGVTYDAVAASIAGDPVYLSVRSVANKPQYLTTVFRDVAGRLPTAEETKAFGPALDRMDRASFVLALLRQDAPLARLVSEWYSRYLGRAPSTAELRRHASQLRAGVSWEAAQAELVASPEYVALQALRFNETCRGPRPPESSLTRAEPRELHRAGN